MMDKVGKGVMAKPLLTTAIIILITAGFIGAFAVNGLTSEMDEESFTPDLKEQEADKEISNKFTSTYGISIFVRSEDKESSIIEPETMANILELESRLYNESLIQENLNHGTYSDVSSIADLLAQVGIQNKLMESMDDIMKEQMGEMMKAVGLVINSTVDIYVQEGLGEEGQYLKTATWSYVSSKLPAIQENATGIAYGMYQQKRALVIANVTAAVQNEIAKGFGSMEENLTAQNYSAMDNGTAMMTINGTIDLAISNMVENASATAAYALGTEIGPVVEAGIGYQMGEVMKEAGIGLGMAYGQVIMEKSGELMDETITGIEAAIGQNLSGMMDQGEETGGMEGQMDMINKSVEYAVLNLSSALQPMVMGELNTSMGYISEEFSAAVGENLSIQLYGLGEELKPQVYAQRNDTNAVTALVDSHETRALANTTAVNTSFTVVDGYFAGFNPLDMEAALGTAMDQSWAAGVIPPLNQTYEAMMSGFKQFDMPADAFQSSGSASAGMDLEEFFSALQNLTYGDKKKVFLGGHLSLNIMGTNLDLNFDTMSTEDLQMMIYDIYQPPIKELSYLTEAMNMSFTKEFDPPFRNYTDVEAVGSMISISFKPETRETDGLAKEVEEKIGDIVEDFDEEHEECEYTTLGNYTISNAVMNRAMDSMYIIMPIALVAVIIILAIVYRSGFDLLISLTALIMALIWVYGFQAVLGYPFNPMLIAVPVLIVGLGIDFGIHITLRYREELTKGNKIDESMTNTIGSVGTALLLATFTTMLAFLSNAISPIPTLAQFGILAAFGIFASFLIMVTFVPAVKALRDKRRIKKGKRILKGLKYGKGRKDVEKKDTVKGAGVRVLNKGLSMGAVGSERHPGAVIIIALLLTAGGIYSSTLISTKFDFKDFLPEEVPLARELRFMMDEYGIEDIMGGNVRVLIEGDIDTIETLEAIDRSVTNMNDDKYVVKDGGEAEVRSVLSVMHDYANLSGANDYRYNSEFRDLYFDNFDDNGNVIANDDGNITQLFDWLYDNAQSSARSILYKSNATGEYEATVLSIEVDIGDNKEHIYELRGLINEDVEPLKDLRGGTLDRVMVTSGPILTQLVLDSMNQSQLNSIIITLVVSLVVLTIIYYISDGSRALGGLTVLPMIFCIGWLFGAMYLLGINLNVMTITIASLTIGIGITYGIHVSHRYAEDLRKIKDPDEAMYSTVTNVGTAVFGAAATTIVGFGLLVFTLLSVTQQFGGITALSILFSFLSSIFVLPSFLILWAKKKASNENREE